jgi:AhpD family alkylhydroperoxidase
VTSLQEIEWEECLLEPRRDAELEREARRSMGVVPPYVRLFSPCPWIARSILHGNFRQDQLVHIELALADLIFLAVSQDNSCRYCYTAQRSILRILGFEEERIQRLELAASTPEANPRDRLALDFARRISRANPPPSRAERAALVDAGFADEAVKEIAYVAASTAMSNRLTTLPALPMETAEPDKLWYVRLLRPLVARRFRSRRGQPERLAPELKTGPYSYVTLELDGLPVARVLREVLDRAFESPILPPRAKALIFAVVARGLGSGRAEEEAKGRLASLGLDEEGTEEVLAHLTSPELDPIEASLVPFARETIRYRSADIQRRARKLQEGLSVEQFLEVVGIVALANAVCRLSLVLCET